MPESVITYCGQKAKVNCDGKCSKAWGRNLRPRVSLSDDKDDFAFMADGELETAPVDPGTYEGGVAKPRDATYFPTKWCVRECERCALSHPGEWDNPLAIKSFESRVFNRKQPE